MEWKKSDYALPEGEKDNDKYEKEKDERMERDDHALSEDEKLIIDRKKTIGLWGRGH